MAIPAHRAALVGTRLALSGAVLYLLEWVAIIAIPAQAPSQPGTPAAQVLADYAGHADGLALWAGWFSIVLIGRVLFVIGVRTSLARSGRSHPLIDLAVAAMSLSVALEIATYALAAAAGQLAEEGNTVATVTLDRAAMMLNLTIAGPLSVAILCTVIAMWKSGLFPRSLVVVGLLAGLPVLVASLLIGPDFVALMRGLSFGVFIFWIWMLWTGVLLWFRTPKRVPDGDSAVRQAT